MANLARRAYSAGPRKQQPSVLYNTMWAAGVIGVLGFGGLYLTDASAGIHKYVITPAIHLLDPEQAHDITIMAMKFRLSPRDRKPDDDALKINIWGKDISNPIGMAAGFDKNCNATDSLFDLGYGVVEVGSITPEPQSGNPKPRLFRVEESEAVINRMGLNNVGIDVCKDRLRSRFWKHVINQSKTEKQNATDIATSINRSGIESKLLGINVSKNHSATEESYDDFVKGIKELGSYADYVVINVSCPNVKNLGANSNTDTLEQTICAAIEARDSLPDGRRPPVVIKIGPDNSDEQLHDIADVALKYRVGGIITTNTTRQRPGSLVGDEEKIAETGGLSGAPLKDLSLGTTRKMYKLTGGQIPIIGCGGIRNADDAIAYAKAGASFVQIYTTMIYNGPGIVREIKDGIVSKLEGKRWKDIIGQDVKG
ncbi:dihydroorotate dehydrogenase [Mycoemilia scoparia]|uniref:Dihydroorotate dehydrogenase (quinone), mitochondrial n=1 Tax=Mycoemilia scoparia TaxID=417184 RepID=A0A9W7ZZE6_9FUNG|nr:dihydroorotate dehydrogenase [Mycoemilia scoparia]